MFVPALATLVIVSGSQIFGTPTSHGHATHTSEPQWVSLFNGKDLTGWSPKIQGFEYGNNYAHTFRVQDHKIVVSYSDFPGKFEGHFGHLFYAHPYSNYILKLDYHFMGSQLPDGPGWAFKNSGIMIHCQDPKTMGLNQDFPVSAEVQLLGGDGTSPRPTANVCSPGTNIVMDGKLITRHCNDSTSPTFSDDNEWVHVEVEVHGYGEIIHRVNGKEVLRYSQVQLDPNDPDAKKLIHGTDLAIRGGFISLQSESHPCEFRNIYIKDLDAK